MPIYEYECRDCGERFEHLMRGSEKPACPSCGGKRLEKQISAPAAPQMAHRRTSGCCSAEARKACDATGGCGGCPCAMGH
jgi:putative FmdB family regulatory protein